MEYRRDLYIFIPAYNVEKELAELSLAYPPCVRALLGAIYELIGIDTYLIRQTLNGMTSYKLPISETALPNKKNWNII